MKKLILSILCLYIASNFVNGQVCPPTTTFNGSATNTFTIADPNGNIGGFITNTNGIQLNAVQGARECRAFTSIPTLGNTFTAECSVSLTGGSNPWHSPLTLSAGNLEYIATATGCDLTNQNNCASYSNTNQTAIIVNFVTPGLGGPNDILIAGTSIVVYTKLGNAAAIQASTPIAIPIANFNNFNIRLERISATQGLLSFIVSGTIINTACFAIPSTLTGLNTLQAGVNTTGSNVRSLSATFNNYRISNSCVALPQITVAPSTILCGNNTSLTANSTILNSTFNWYNVSSGGSIIATGSVYKTPILYATTTYYVSYTNACGYTSPRTAVVVTVNPSVLVQSITGSSTLCKNQIIALECATTGGTWSSSDITKATVKQSGVVTGVSTGTVTIYYTVTNGLCSSVATKVITIDDVVSFIIVGPSPVCPNTEGNPYYVSPAVNGADYTWNIQNGPNVGVNFPVNGSTNTTLKIPDAVANNQFTLRCQGLNACGTSQIITKLITVNTNVPPVPDVSCSGTNGTNTCVNLVASNSSGNTIEWIVNGVVQSTSTSFVRPLETSVLCTYTNPISGCKKSTWYSPAVVCTYSLRTSSTEVSDNALKVYPNPNNGNFTFVTRGYVGKVQIVNILGQIIEEISVAENVFTYEVSMTDKPKGTYLVRLTGGNENHVSVIVIQ